MKVLKVLLMMLIGITMTSCTLDDDGSTLVNEPPVVEEPIEEEPNCNCGTVINKYVRIINGRVIQMIDYKSDCDTIITGVWFSSIIDIGTYRCFDI